MNVSLTPELKRFVEDKVKRGEFRSANEVVCAGLQLLRERDAEYQAQLDVLRRTVGEGIDQARRERTRDGFEVFADVRSRRGGAGRRGGV